VLPDTSLTSSVQQINLIITNLLSSGLCGLCITGKQPVTAMAEADATKMAEYHSEDQNSSFTV